MDRRLLAGRAPALNDDIAIVGAACRLPGAPSLPELAVLLFSGTDAITEIPDDRWSKPMFYHPDSGQRGKAYTFAAGVIDNVYGFDAAFFGISPREAVHIDPQQRLMLELAHEAMEDAGLDGADLAGTDTGVYVGGSAWDHTTLHAGDWPASNAYTMTGATLCSLANRVSHVFDLKGPSFTVDTACSSSLVALHLAAEALREGRVSAALVGGVNMLLAPQNFVGFCRASMLSRRGRCHAFDARADGYVRAEGGGVVVLKPLRAALEAGDRIRAVLRATGVNSDGRTTGFSLPNKDAQAALLQDTYARFAIAADELDYLEAHGTGTPAGDPIEAGALGRVLGQARSTPLPIGSVKTNVGHLEAGSGMAGLMKALLVLQNGAIPRSLHCETPNPGIDFAALNLALVPEARPLRANGHLPTVGINSFGFGGTNAHAVLSAAPLQRLTDPRLTDPLSVGAAEGKLPPLLLSARSQDALRTLVATWRDQLATTPAGAVPALLRAAARRREHHQTRLAVLGDTPEALAHALDGYLADADGQPVATGAATGGTVAFVFSGNGSQWAGMGLDAMRGNPAFRAGLQQVDAVLRPLLGWSVMERLGQPGLVLGDTEIAQPLLFAIQVAATLALAEAGVRPAACMGHSVGEVAAAWAAGALSLEQAALVIHARSQRQQATHGVGGMAVLALSYAAAVDAVTPLGLEVAADNATNSVTVAGPEAGMAALADLASSEGWAFTRLDLAYAFHSAAMGPIEAPLQSDLATLAPGPAAIPFVSTVTGAALDGRLLGGGYWWTNVRRPVRFAQAARALVAAGTRIFLEVGPQPVLQSYLHDALRAAATPGAVLSTLSRRRQAADPFALAAIRCHVAGLDLSGHAMFDGPASPDGLPAYPWQRETYILNRSEEATDLVGAASDHPLLGWRTAGAEEWTAHLDVAVMPFLADHAVGGAPVLPAAAMVSLMLAAARVRHPSGPLEITDLEIGRALPFEAGQTRAVRTRVSVAGALEGEGRLSLASRTRLQDEAWTVHATARIGAAATAGVLGTWEDAASPIDTLPATRLYALAAEIGLVYGPTFQTVTKVAITSETVAHVSLAAVRAPVAPLEPTLLDGALQGLLALAARRMRDRQGTMRGMMPWRFGRVRLLSDGVPATAALRITKAGPRAVAADILLRDVAGKPVAELLECWFVSVALGVAADPAQRCLRVELVDAADAAAEPPAPALLDAALATVMAETTEADAVAAALADGYVSASAYRALSAVDTPSPLRSAMLAWLQQDGLADEAGQLVDAADLPPAEAMLGSLLFDVPGAAADAALLAAGGEALGPVLRGDTPRPVPGAALLDQMLCDSPAGRRAQDGLAAAAEAVARAWPAGRVLRVLELGAGRGTATRTLAPLLRRACPGIRYVAATTEALQPVLADAVAGLDGVNATVWRADAAGTFDLVLSLHGLTRLGLDTPGLEALRGCLAPGGLLLAAEPLPNRVWDLVGVPGTHPATHGGIATPLAAEDWVANLALAGWDARAAALAPSAWPSVLVAAQSLLTAPARAPLTGRLLLLAEPGDTWADAVRDALRAEGAAAVIVDADQIARPGRLAGVAGVVVLVPDNRDLAASWLGRIAGIVEPLAAVPTPLSIVTRASASGEPLSAALTGLRRVLANEAAGIRARTIRVDRALDTATAAARLAAELLAPDAEDEVALGMGRRVPRLRPGLPLPAGVPGPTVLAVGRPGLLGTLHWQAAPPRAPLAADEVAVTVRAAGLNFRDVMWAMGLLPDEALLHGFAGATIGLECAGTVSAIGPAVTGLAVGDAVMAFAPASLGTEVITRRHAVARLPAGLSFAAGATIPVAFFTVAYALGELARLEPGERVLIHGGAGGVGLAAIQYARHRGATVFATAGSPAKRALLRQLGVDHVLDSRDLAFADEIMALTAGEGVDVVLNSLSGEAMERSLGLLRPFGRFLELGKRDFYRNTPVGIRPLRHNASYFAIDADQLPMSRPALAARLLGEITGLLETGALRPLPYRSFEFGAAVDAFRLMQSAGHVGKVILEPGPTPPMATGTAIAFAARPDGAYVVTGGLSGFGLETARWLVRHGARHLALLGRRGAATPGADAALAAFAAEGVMAQAFATDVGNPAALAATLDAIRAALPPIRGVVHAAMVMDDAFLPALDTARFAAVLDPKWGGAEALDALTRTDPVELFLLFSSITTVLGNPGQASYVAANAALEALAERRQAEGLPALAIGWGPIGDAGYLARSPEVSEALARRLGTAHLNAADALDVLPAMLASGEAVVHYAELAGARRAQLPLLGSPLYEALALRGAEVDGPAGDLRTIIAGRTPEDARRVVAEALAHEVAAILQLPPGQVDITRPLASFGMDSLMAVELRTAVEARFGVNVPLFSLSEGVTLLAMAGKLVSPLLGDASEAAPDATPDVVSLMISRYETGDDAPPPVAAKRPTQAASA